jgi:chromosome segregation ATPase
MVKTRHFGVITLNFRAMPAMTELENAIVRLDEFVAALRQGLEEQLGALATGCDETRAAFEQIRADGAGQAQRLRQLEERTEGQSELIETLRQEAAEARDLQSQLRERDLEIERLTSELQAKKEIVQALRQQTREGEDARARAGAAEQQLAGQQQELDASRQTVASLNAELDKLRAEVSAAQDAAVDSAELGALRAELDARRTMIKSLRDDARRAEALEAQLEAKRETIGELEQALEQHVLTIEDLRQSADAWRRKYQAVKGETVDTEGSLADPPLFTDTEIEALKQIENGAASGSDAGFEDEVQFAERTVAIDMRGALSQARAQKTGKAQ